MSSKKFFHGHLFQETILDLRIGIPRQIPKMLLTLSWIMKHVILPRGNRRGNIMKWIQNLIEFDRWNIERERIINRLMTALAKMKIWLKIGASRSEEVESFPEEGLLSATITHLDIDGFPKLRALQQLTSLKYPYICHCHELETMPEEGLPISLQHLIIKDCPLLEKICQPKKGKYWSKIRRPSSKSITRLSNELYAENRISVTRCVILELRILSC